MNYSPMYISIKSATIATIIVFILGIYIAYKVTKLNKFKAIIDGVLTLPMVLPPTVIGFFLLSLLGKQSIIGSILSNYNKSIVFSPTANIIAAAVVSFPLVYRTSRGAFEQLDKNMIYAAETLGISNIKIFFRIILPNCFSTIIAGTVLAFARALGEFGATIMLAGNIPGKTQTMSIAVYTSVQSGNTDLAYKWVAIMLAISLISMLVINIFERTQISK